MLKTGKAKNLDTVVFISNTVDNKKNPLSHDERRRIITKTFPGLTIGPATIRTPNDVLTWAKTEGYRKVFFVVGADRRPEFKALIDGWVDGADPKHTVDVRLMALSRNAARVSGSIARRRAIAGNLEGFQSLVMSGVADETAAARIMKIIKSRLSQVTTEINTRMKTFREWLNEAPDDVPEPEESTQSGMGGPADGVAPPDDAPTEDGAALDAPEDTPETELPLNSPANSGRVPSDTPDQQAQLVIHPSQRLKKTMVANLKMLRQRNAT